MTIAPDILELLHNQAFGYLEWDGKETLEEKFTDVTNFYSSIPENSKPLVNQLLRENRIDVARIYDVIGCDEPFDMEYRLLVNCNDTFAWGSADCQVVLPSQLVEYARFWDDYPRHGGDIWVMKQRSEKPQEPMIEILKKTGEWEDWMDKLEDNKYDVWRKENYSK